MHDGAVIFAHHSVSPRDMWASWSVDPLTIVLLALSALLYAVGAARLQRRGRPPAIRRTISFYAGLGILVVALLSPLHALAEVLLSAHMVQHLLLILFAAPLLIYGAGLVSLMVGLPRGLRRFVQRIRSVVAPTFRILLNPVVVGCLHALAMWSWHLPALYRWGLRSSAVHAVEHASFLATALLFWVVVVGAARRRRPPIGVAILLVFATMLQSSALGAVLTFATRPLYSIHIVGAREWGIEPLVDQELAGLIMWIPAGAIYLVTMAVLFGAWLKDADRRSPTVAPETPPRRALE
jgi:putative membrane protein